MTPAPAARDDEAREGGRGDSGQEGGRGDSGQEGGRGDSGQEGGRGDQAREGSWSRRGLLRSGAAAALAFASAGCLSNPWSPGATAAESAGGDETTSDDRGVTTTDDGATTADGTATTADGTATTSDGDDAGTSDGDDAGTTTVESEHTTTEPSTTATATEVPAAEKDPDLVVEVAPDGFNFSPESFEISAGDTVHWEWKDSGHNVRVKESPGDSDWTGTPGDATDTYGEGYLHAHTFEASGEYEYYCAPHRSLGLRGSFTVR